MRVRWGEASIGIVALILLFAVDFHLDVRERDVFSWMDPYQYYEFSLDVVQGRATPGEFEIPSLFPYLVMPFLVVDASIPASLWVNFAAMLLLLVGLHGLRSELGMRTPTAISALLVLSSPILIGLARTLYIEFTLTAIATAVFLLWLRFLRRMDWPSGLAFAATFGVAYMIKTTFHLFMLAPIAAAVIGRLAQRRRGDAVALVAAVVSPIVLAVAIHLTVFSRSIGYYLNLVSTNRPFMYLMGPPDSASWSAVTYYFRELGRSLLFFLTPCLAIPVIASGRRAGRLSLGNLAGPRVALWLWLIGPLVLLAAHPLKEPRHVAPCVVPAVLLVLLGVEDLPRRAVRVALTAFVSILAVAQYAAVTSGRVEAPYFLDRSLHYQALRDAMIRAAPVGRYRSTPPGLRMLHWKYDQNVAIAGFPPNEALALTWQGFPGVAYDLATFADPERISERIPYRQFEDLFFLAAINTYNARCGWRWYHGTLDRDEVIDNADFLILNDFDSRELRRLFPNHAIVATIPRGAGEIHVLRSRRPTTPYRTLYARAFLERNPGLPAQEIRTIAEEMLIAAVLGGDTAAAKAIARDFPVLGEPGVTARNIYWIGGYPALLELTRQLIEKLPTGAPR